MSTITMTYGAYNFTPVPLFNISKEMQKTADSTFIGTVFKLTLNGTLVSISPGGLAQVMAKQQDLREAFIQDGLLLQILCDDVVIFSAYPRILGPIQFPPSDDNWVFTSPYTIELEYDEEPGDAGENSSLMPPYISEATEQWTVEAVEDKSYYSWNLDTVGGNLDAAPYQLRISHTVEAKGKSHYASGGLRKPAWQEAREYVNPLLGFNDEFAVLSGTLNFGSNEMAPYNHMRTATIDEAGGGYNVSETWLVINPSGSGIAGTAIEDFTIEIRKGLDRDLTTVNIQGTIQGLEERIYGNNPGDFQIPVSKWDNASAYWDEVESRLRYRAVFASSGVPTRSLALTPNIQTIGHNPTNGVITYNYEYNDRPSNCVAGSLTESIVINDSNPVDVFASLPVLGRAAGPVLQGMGTVTSATREVIIDVVMPIGTGCTVANLLADNPRTDVASLLCLFEADLENNYGQVFKNQDSESWNPKDGRYSRTVGWTYQTCSGVPPTLC